MSLVPPSQTDSHIQLGLTAVVMVKMNQDLFYGHKAIPFQAWRLNSQVLAVDFGISGQFLRAPLVDNSPLADNDVAISQFQ